MSKNKADHDGHSQSDPSHRNQAHDSGRASPSSLRTLLWVAAGCAIAAIGVHLYLLTEHYNLRFGQVSSQSLCNVNALFNCAAVSASRYSEFLGAPMALWGMAANLALVILIAFHKFTEYESSGRVTAESSASARNVLLASGFIALTSIVMGGISMFLLSHLCPFCILAYVLSFATFAFAWLGLPSGQRLGTIELGNFKVPVILALVAVIGVFISDDQARKSYGSRDFQAVTQTALQGWSTAPQQSIKTENALITGASSEKAKMIITEFADFRCPHCRHAAPVLKAFADGNDDVQLQFEAWPLDGECNTSIPSSNGVSCLLARTVNCAQSISAATNPNNAKGWAAHEYIFEHQESYGTMDGVKGGFNDIAQAVGIPKDQLQACVDSDTAKASLQKEAAVGSALSLAGTPTIFVNGRKLEYGQFLPVLQAIHAEILKNQKN